jgi:hypothetical protein
MTKRAFVGGQISSQKSPPSLKFKFWQLWLLNKKNQSSINENKHLTKMEFPWSEIMLRPTC